ncbi:TIGR00730 family Rossman fold protein [Streptomyces sp. L2]|uniref:LOG family protein n=1 Tax=Streptomyces sp. L2 TaxID=2162665 RepID=UPI0010107FB4|nr:TIGR00730 family Rossman fold protein [Streptomyces sp. L2]
MRICVFCGGLAGHRHDYASAARHLGEQLTERGITLVYGGSHLGLMGILADTVLAHGGEVTGVIPRSLMREEVAHPSLSHLHVVEGLSERKHRMIQLADMFLALPGGLGTLNEMSEVLTLAKLAHVDKPSGLLNTAGYYDDLLAFTRHAASEGFLSPSHAELLIIGDQPADVLDRLLASAAITTDNRRPDAGLRRPP